MSPEIVVDVGCAYHGVDTTQILIDRFRPHTYYGFDPLSSDSVETIGETTVVISHKAAWLYDGQITFEPDGDASRVGGDEGEDVPCFDFGSFLEHLLSEHTVVVKLDCEGSEFRLIDEMRERNQLERLERLLVEWHIPCPVEQWEL